MTTPESLKPNLPSQSLVKVRHGSKSILLPCNMQLPRRSDLYIPRHPLKTQLQKRQVATSQVRYPIIKTSPKPNPGRLGSPWNLLDPVKVIEWFQENSRPLNGSRNSPNWMSTSTLWDWVLCTFLWLPLLLPILALSFEPLPSPLNGWSPATYFWLFDGLLVLYFLTGWLGRVDNPLITGPAYLYAGIVGTFIISGLVRNIWTGFAIVIAIAGVVGITAGIMRSNGSDLKMVALRLISCVASGLTVGTVSSLAGFIMGGPMTGMIGGSIAVVLVGLIYSVEWHVLLLMATVATTSIVAGFAVTVDGHAIASATHLLTIALPIGVAILAALTVAVGLIIGVARSLDESLQSGHTAWIARGTLLLVWLTHNYIVWDYFMPS